MIVGFSSYGTGSAGSAVNYLTDKERLDRKEKPPEVIKGDINATRQLVDSLDFKHKYTSGVLSFAPEEKITPEMEISIIDRFEQVAFAGLSEDRYSIAWVRHEHAGHHELHFITARVDLETGKSLNIKPPGKETQAVYDDFRSEINARYGLASPDDPSRTRDLKLTDAELKANLTDKNGNIKETVNDILMNRAIAGAIKNRDDVLDSLKELGFDINRSGKNHITIKAPETGEKYRLKGTLYEQNFDVSRAIESATTARERDYSKPDERTAREYQARVDEHIAKRSEYNASRYGQNHQENLQTDLNKEHLLALVSRDNAISRSGNRDDGLHGIQQQQPDRNTSESERTGSHKSTIGKSRDAISSNGLCNGEQSSSEVLNFKQERENNEIRNTAKERVRACDDQRDGAVNNDRARDKTIENYRESFRSIESGANKINYTFSRISDTAERTRERVKECNNGTEQQEYSDNRASKPIEDVSNRLEQITRQIEIILQNIAYAIREKLLKKEKDNAEKLKKELDKLADQFVKELNIPKAEVVEAINDYKIDSLEALDARLSNPERTESMKESAREIHRWNEQSRERDREQWQDNDFSR